MPLAHALPAGMARATFPAMGTTVEVLLPERELARGERIACQLFEEWEAALSRFRPESELARLNARAGELVEVSPLLLSVLQTAVQAAAATDGIYDPTLLGQIIAVGYGSSFESLPAHQTPPVHPVKLRPGGDWRQIRVDATARRVTLPHGSGLDFGGIGKGMAVDASVERLRAAGMASGLVNAGGDLAVIGPPPGLDAWPVEVPGRHPEDAHVVPLAAGGMATSGVARRHWRQGTLERHHLLDPRTGAPATSGLWSVTVVAGTCAQAEIAAKVAFILGPVEGPRFLQRHALPGVLVHDDGQLTTAGGWPLPLPSPTAGVQPTA
jgi:thiamine biosynthesis lipoprotein